MTRAKNFQIIFQEEIHLKNNKIGEVIFYPDIVYDFYMLGNTTIIIQEINERPIHFEVALAHLVYFSRYIKTH